MDVGSTEQLSLDEIGDLLQATTFVVVDLETAGGNPAEGGITEIGAVKLHGGEVVAEFSTLVNPGVPIPPFIASLTGITNAVVASAPTLSAVLPSFLDFAAGSVLVAHNAPYDVSFLKGACAQLELPWPKFAVIDTARLARVTLHRDEVRNCKLATLAAYFATTVQPTHRALDDARATSEVLHHLFERSGSLGARTVQDVNALCGRVSTAQRTKRHLADGLPAAPGVYIFEDAKGDPLYVGTSVNIRTRVRSYFTASEQRRRMAEMITIAQRVRPIVCSTDLEARIRELRLIASEQPRYNRASRAPEAAPWIRLTDEAAPRLAVVRKLDGSIPAQHLLGPFGSAAAAAAALEAIQLAIPIRTCTTKLAKHPRSITAACIRHELGRCPAPCMADHDREAYANAIAQVHALLSGDLRAVECAVNSRMAELSAAERYEEAALWRDRLGSLSRVSERCQATQMLAANAEVIAARPTPDGGWDVHCVRYGTLAGATRVPVGADPKPYVAILQSTSACIDSPGNGRVAGLEEEARELLAWLWLPGTRLVSLTGVFAIPVHCGGHLRHQFDDSRRQRGQWLASGDPNLRPAGPAAGSAVSRIALRS